MRREVVQLVLKRPLKYIWSSGGGELSLYYIHILKTHLNTFILIFICPKHDKLEALCYPFLLWFMNIYICMTYMCQSQILQTDCGIPQKIFPKMNHGTTGWYVWPTNDFNHPHLSMIQTSAWKHGWFIHAQYHKAGGIFEKKHLTVTGTLRLRLEWTWKKAKMFLQKYVHSCTCATVQHNNFPKATIIRTNNSGSNQLYKQKHLNIKRQPSHSLPCVLFSSSRHSWKEFIPWVWWEMQTWLPTVRY